MNRCEDCIYRRKSVWDWGSIYCGKRGGELVSSDGRDDYGGCEYFCSRWSGLGDLKWWWKRIDFNGGYWTRGFINGGIFDCCADCVYMDLSNEDLMGYFYCKKQGVYYTGGKKTCNNFKQKSFNDYIHGTSEEPPEDLPEDFEESTKEIVSRESKKNDDENEYEDLHRRARHGDPEAQNQLGDLFFNGCSKWGIKQNYQEAIWWYRKAATQDNPSAQNSLGWMYQNGLGGVKRDYQKAVKWYKKAATQGNSSAQNNLGWMYHHGLGVNRDYREAIRYYQKATECGNSNAKNNLADVQNILGDMYFNGKEITQDYSEAMYFYSSSAENGNSYGQYRLAIMYENGYGVEQNLMLAKMWYEKAMDNGYTDAQESLNRIIETIQKIAKTEQHHSYMTFKTTISLLILFILCMMFIPRSLIGSRLTGVFIVFFFIIFWRVIGYLLNKRNS